MVLAPVLGAVGLLGAGLIYLYVARQSDGTDRMREIAADIHEGAVTFLKREYSVLGVFIAAVFALVFWGINLATATSFFGGALCSLCAGFIGMKAATKANVRTAYAASRDGRDKALNVAFSGGAVMGLAVASLGLFGVACFFIFTADRIRPRLSMGLPWARVPSRCLRGSEAGFIRRPRMWARIWSAKSKRAFRKTIREIRR